MGLLTKSDDGNLVDWCSTEVLKARGVPVRLFRDLLVHLAELAVENPNHAILLRGQNQDFRDQDGTIIQPNAFRLANGTVSDAEAKVEKAHKLLCAEVTKRNLPCSVKAAVEHPLIAQALLQHYQLAPTQWLDLTDMPNIAVHFACHNGAGAVVYAFAIPRHLVLHGHQPSKNGLLCWALSSLCPAYALRPHFQRAFAFAELQSDEGTDFPRISQFSGSLSSHLLCKFRINCSMVLGEMVEFGIPQGKAIYPPSYADPMLDVCLTVKRQLELV